MSYTLSDLGWSNHFAAQAMADPSHTPYRITEVHRDRLIGFGPDGTAPLVTMDQSTGAFAVGDWVLADDQGRITRLLERRSVLKRRAAGSGAEAQLIAANVDVLFIVSSCNADFNLARLERYLALAHQAGCYPVIVLTKADECADPQEYSARAEALATFLTVLAVDAREPDDIQQLLGWCPAGQTGALVGSSGVGKTTLTNGMTGSDDATAETREDDARGRHTTTSRSLRRMRNSGWLIDTPGMRALRLLDAQDGVDEVFSDILDLIANCRFTDCTHGVEPGCAVQAAVQAGEVDPERLKRWQKLRREDQRNSETVAETRAREKSFHKMVKSVMQEKKSRRGK
ncbi:MAG: ribosome small subunit-dependent GTPase A [Ruegeria sp.]